MAELTRTIPSLTPGSRYVVRVRAVNGFGVASDWSESLVLLTPGDSSTPNAPTNLVVSFVSADLVLGWDGPTLNTDGSPFNDFKQYEVTLVGNTTSITKVYTTTAEFFVLSILTNQTDFGGETDFSVEIRTVDISDHKSIPLSGNALKEPVLTPDLAPIAYRGFTLISVLMLPPTGSTDVGGYILEHSEDGSGYTVIFEGANNSFTHEVTPASKHFYRYKIKDSFGSVSPGYSPVLETESLGNLVINYGNYCVNSSFELGTAEATAWRIYGAGTPVVTVAQAQAGTKSQQLTYSGNATMGVEQTIVLPIDTIISTSFTATVYIRPANAGKNARIQIRDEINNQTYTSSSIPVSQNVWQRISFTQILPPGVSKFFIRYYLDNAAAADVVFFDAAQVEQAASASVWAPRAIEIPDNYIQSAHIAELSADKISTGSISTAVISVADDGVIQSFNGVAGYQITATGATFQNGYISMIGAGGTTTFDSTSLRAIYGGNTRFAVKNTGVYIGGDTNVTANVYFEGSKTVFQDTSGAYDFIIDTSVNKVMRLTNGVTDVFYLDKTGSAGFAGSITGGTIDIGSADGTPATSFHVDVSGQMWMGDASYASAPFKVSATGDVTARSFVGTSKIADGLSNTLQSENFLTNVRGWQIDGAGNAEFGNLKMRGEFLLKDLSSAFIHGWVVNGVPRISFYDGANEEGNWEMQSVHFGSINRFRILNSITTGGPPSVYLDYDTSISESQIYLTADNVTLIAYNGVNLAGADFITLQADDITLAADNDILIIAGGSGTTTIDNVPSINASSISNVAAGSGWSQGNAAKIVAESVAGNTDSNGRITFSFPQSFNGVFSLVCSNGDVDAATFGVPQIDNVTTSNFIIRMVKPDTGTTYSSQAVRVNYIAVGW